MKWSDVGDQECSIARAMSVVGESWTMLILRELFNGNGRFNGILQATSAPPAIVSDRLGALERDGIIERRPYSARPDRFEHRLTAKGRDLYPVLMSLMAWGDRWMSHDRPPPVQLRHRTCGAVTAPTLTCSACGEAIDPRHMERGAAST